ncbi:hypothetical protein LXL04_027456 [Taraxacum kok-saghyz]
MGRGFYVGEKSKVVEVVPATIEDEDRREGTERTKSNVSYERKTMVVESPLNTTGPPPAPTGPSSDHRRTTAGPPSVTTIGPVGPPPDHCRTTAGPPPDHCRTTVGAPPDDAEDTGTDDCLITCD